MGEGELESACLIADGLPRFFLGIEGVPLAAKEEAEADELLEMCFGRVLDAAEARHMYGRIALYAFRWLIWGV